MERGAVMSEYRISISYTVGEKFTVKAASLAEARQKAMQMADDRLETHDCSEVNYEVMGPNDQYADGCMHG